MLKEMDLVSQVQILVEAVWISLLTGMPTLVGLFKKKNNNKLLACPPLLGYLKKKKIKK